MRNHRITPTLAAVLLTVAVLLTLGACSSTQSTGQQVDDATITSKVKAKLTADPEVNPFNIDVDTDAGVVTLRGRVEDPEAKTEAAKLARNTTGVVSVRNEIRVGERVGSETPASDQAIAAAIQTEIAADTDVAAVNIDVDVQDGVVTLSGVVKTEMARQEAERIARNHDGVRSVVNQLEVRAGK
jgi:hyperosmotically inducible protein